MKKPFKTTLSNGLRVVLLENNVAPVVSWNLWANVGSVNETDEEAGICHLIEHMLFKGTGRRPVGQIAKEVEAAGGDMNAYTSFDETVFYINMSAKRMDVGLDILADAAIDPTFDLGELTKEKEVVVEEISRSEDNPSQMVSQDLFTKAFAVHPYHRPIAGNRETVRGVSQEHLLEFFHKWYVGSNLILIGVGDFQIKEVLPKIETLYAKIPPGRPPNQRIPEEPAQAGPRIVTRGMDVEGRYVDLCFPIPDLRHPDIPALDLLSHVLGSGSSSRLEQVVKEKKQLVSSIGSYPYTPRHPGVFIVGAVLKEKALKETLQASWEEIQKLKEEAPSTGEVHRARENLRSTRVYERQTVEAMARKLGYFEGLAGDLDFEDEYYRRLADVTAEDIQAVADKYLKPERITLAFCHPKVESWPEERLREWLSGLPRSFKKTARAVKPGEVVSFQLPSGVRVLVRENRNLPLVSLRSASLGGLRSESVKNNGINHLISLLVTKGTQTRTAQEIAEQTENLAGHVDGYMGRNLIGLSATFLSEKIGEGMDLFFDLLLRPDFPDDEIQKEKGHTYTAIRNEQDSLSTIAMRNFFKGLYGKHPYGLPSLGSLSSVRSLKRAQLLRHYRETVRPDNLVLSIVGDVSASELRERLKDKFKALKAQEELRRQRPAVIPQGLVGMGLKIGVPPTASSMGFVRPWDTGGLAVRGVLTPGEARKTRFGLTVRPEEWPSYLAASGSAQTVDRMQSAFDFARPPEAGQAATIGPSPSQAGRVNKARLVFHFADAQRSVESSRIEGANIAMTQLADGQLRAVEARSAYAHEYAAASSGAIYDGNDSSRPRAKDAAVLPRVDGASIPRIPREEKYYGR